MRRNSVDRIWQLMEEKNWKQVDIFNNSKPYQEKLGVKLGKSAISQYVNGVQAARLKTASLACSNLFRGISAWAHATMCHGNVLTAETGYSETDLRKMADIAKTFDGKPLDAIS